MARCLVVFYFRRRRPEKLRVSVHPIPEGTTAREFRLGLIADYNRTNKQVREITEQERDDPWNH